MFTAIILTANLTILSCSSSPQHKITINSSPSKVKTYINQKYAGTTPLNFYISSSSNISFRLEKENYYDFAKKIKLEHKTNITFLLSPLTFLLHINCNFKPDRLYIDSNLCSTNKISLKAGRHKLTAFKKGYDLIEKTFTGTEAANKNINLTFRQHPHKCILNIKSKPAGARIYINNKLSGYTPLKLTHLKSRSYTIDIKKTNYISFNIITFIKKGKTKTVNAKLTPK
ncbi:MAG TPA: PEGA domain-containing protein [Spirochaetota bacterium]|nr:PEGA domain-containing protein [Spirochaetota bacterium]